MDEEESKKYKNKKVIMFMLFILFLILILMIANVIGKIGYVNSPKDPVQLIEVDERDINWDMLEKLNIFGNRSIDYIIAPGSTGTYSFMVNNTTDKSLTYDLQLKEINDNKINMKYRLKLENVYVAGDKDNYLEVENVNLENVVVTPNSSNLFTLEWQWEDDDKQDTIIGSLNYAEYTLRIRIKAKFYDKTLGER